MAAYLNLAIAGGRKCTEEHDQPRPPIWSCRS